MLSLVLLIVPLVPIVHAQYTPDWDSLDSRPLPEWYDDAKIGIFIHAGVYSVPGFGAWCWTEMDNINSTMGQYVQKTQPPSFSYMNYAADYKMELFDPEKFAELVEDAGAKYFVYTSKHHEGFVNTKTDYSFGWNSVDVGPKRDILKELRTSIVKKNIHFGIYYSLYEWFNPLYQEDKYNNFSTMIFPLTKMLPEMIQLTHELEPEIIWADGDWEADDTYFGSKEFLAWLYNESPVKETIVVNDRWGKGDPRKHGGFWTDDNWDSDILVPHKWESSWTVVQSPNGWAFRRDIGTNELPLETIQTADELVDHIVKTVALGGNVLLDVGPTPEGTIQPILQERLKQVGTWLKINGEAIYGTRVWKNQKENGTDLVWYTANKTGDVVYLMIRDWPKNGVLQVEKVKLGSSGSINMIGLTSEMLKYEQHDDYLQIQLPKMSTFKADCPKCDWAYVFKVTGFP